MVSRSEKDQLSASVSQLRLDTGASMARKPNPVAPLKTVANDTAKAKKKSIPVADSWEDEDISDDDEQQDYDDDGHGAPNSPRNMPDPPPPTPITPTLNAHHESSSSSSSHGTMAKSYPMSHSGGRGVDKRPEKTDAVARRMIAGALGLKAPRLTDEQKSYEKAIKEQEKARREREREERRHEEEEAARAKTAIWED